MSNITLPNIARRADIRGQPSIALLTRAERDVAALVVDGNTNPEIARLLGISRHTVESHLKHIFVKLAICSRVRLAVLFHDGQAS